MNTRLRQWSGAVVAALMSSSVLAATIENATTAMKKAVEFYHTRASSHGGYVYRYSADFSLREAEGIPDRDTIWIQPPGTPAVGDAMLDVYEAIGHKPALDAAIAAAQALARTQLASGGWDYSGHFDAAERERKLYRRDADGDLIQRDKVPRSEAGWHIWRERKFKDSNYSTLDDDVTQSAVRLLLRVDHALKGADDEIHEAAQSSLTALRAAQYPNGAWSALYDRYPESSAPERLYPVMTASFPDDWPRKWPKDFTGCYVLNDNLHATAMSTLLMAWKLNGDKEALSAAMKAGDFLVLAQMPEPQRAWAQQYDAQMRPVWSRAFEPTAISGRESQAAMWALLKLTAATGEKKYLQPIPAAVAYLRKSLLPNGKLARFYEVKTNKPLYFERGKGGKGFELTYDGSNASSNYGWEWNSELEAIETVHAQLVRGESVVFPPMERDRWPTPPADKDVDQILSALNEDGAWIETEGDRGFIRDADGRKQQPAGGVIHSDTFVQNVRALAAWVKKKKPL